MSKCSRCQNDFTPLLKSDGLPYKLCDRCRCTDKKYRDKHKEQIKLYRDQYYLNNQDKIKEYREVNNNKIKRKSKRISPSFSLTPPTVLSPRSLPIHWSPAAPLALTPHLCESIASVGLSL